MSDKSQERYAEIVARSIEAAGTTDRESREKIYDRLRAANERTVESRLTPEAAGAMRRSLELAITSHESKLTDRPPPTDGRAEQPVPPARRSFAVPLGACLVAGIALGAFATVMWQLQSKPDRGLHDAAKLDAALVKSQPHLDAAVAFLEKVRKEVEAQQASDPWGVDKRVGKKLRKLEDFSAALDDDTPKLPGGGKVLVAATADGYKIIFTSALCSAAKLVRPALVDPVRDQLPVGCSHFGVWNEVGAAY